EPVHWESYPGHQFLHTIGALPCCAKGGCWKSRCQKMNDGDKKDTENLCERPVYHGDGKWATAQCMEMIRPGAVIDAIERYC
ncbi:MAG: ADP-heptose--LPS heptosyltransferase, partial [Verrucomicrobia bacterium]|nr:ADP-heptose--LPS heptosyltransferase [Verrucomicrobiota bacterium]